MYFGFFILIILEVRTMSNDADFFQLSPGSIGSDWAGVTTHPSLRSPMDKMSKYGALNYGPRRSNDYELTTPGFQFIQNEKPEIGSGFGVDRGYFEYNPYVWGSTVKRVLDDKQTKMGLGGIDQPGRDVIDKKLADPVQDTPLGTTFKNYPKEGYSSYGKKGDKAIPWAGNTWLRKPAS